MNIKFKNIWRSFLKLCPKCFMILCLAAILPVLTIYKIYSLDFLSQNEPFAQRVTDFYDKAIYHSDNIGIEQDIVIIGTDEINRNELAQLLEIIWECEPCVIGLDVTFRELSESDSLLLNALRLVSSRLICPELKDIDPQEETLELENQESSPYIGCVTLGNVSLDALSGRDVIREFYTKTKETKSFAYVLAERKNPKAVSILNERGNMRERISYATLFCDTCIKAEDVINLDFDPFDLKDRIVLLGSLHDPSDMYVTPIDINMPGVKIHAYSISTILNGRYFVKSPDWTNKLFAAIYSFLIIMLNIVFPKKTYKGIVTKLVPILITLFLLYLCYHFYKNNFLFIDFSLAVFLSGCSMLAITIWEGTPDLLKDLWKGVKRLGKKSQIIIRK